jgi:UDP-N-acetylglucosamine 2-epimerase (non-hydrolysing)
MKPAIDLVAGARPNFMKLAPVARALAVHGTVSYRIVHTGQHYDASMDRVFFEELDIPAPDVHLEVGSGTHGAQTARLLERYEAHLLRARPEATVVFGDVNSTLACALAAVKLGVGVVHVEAGLRSLDRRMPEEINRLLTDAIADLLLISEPSGLEHLRREGIPEAKVRFVGNVMIDSLLHQLPVARERGTARMLGLAEKGYGLLTLHRPSNVDDPSTLDRLLTLSHELSARLPLVFPVHPRTLASARRSGIEDRLAPGNGRFLCLGPTTYLDTISLAAGAALVLTDSGGLQEETSVLRVPCLSLRENTERPVTVTLGTSRLVGSDTDRIRIAFDDALAKRWPVGADIPLWDGRAAERVAAEIEGWLTVHRQTAGHGTARAAHARPAAN